MTYFLDANIISYILKNIPSVIRRLTEIITDGNEIRIPSIAYYAVKRGLLIEDDDLFIGCSALENNAVLLTNNVRHLKRIEGLQIETIK